MGGEVQDGGVEGCVFIFSCKNSKITVIDRRLLDTPCPRAKEKPPQDGRRGKIAFRIKPHTHQKRLEGSNKTLCVPGGPTETEPDLPVSV